MIPPRYTSVDYDRDVPQHIKDLFAGIFNTRKGLYIHGTVGAGKTHIAYAILKHYEEPPATRRGVFWNTAELLQEIKDDYDRHTTDKNHTFERLMESNQLLFLDDIGSETPTDWVRERFYSVINRRYNHCLPIIFTSNFTIAQLSTRLGDRIASRIVEMSHVVHIVGEDRRIKKQSDTQ